MDNDDDPLPSTIDVEPSRLLQALDAVAVSATNSVAVVVMIAPSQTLTQEIDHVVALFVDRQRRLTLVTYLGFFPICFLERPC